jgi:hypothetical protein
MSPQDINPEERKKERENKRAQSGIRTSSVTSRES